MRFELFDAAVHLCGVLVEKYLDRPYRAGEDIEKHVFNAYTAELLVECLARVQTVGRNDARSFANAAVIPFLMSEILRAISAAF